MHAPRGLTLFVLGALVVPTLATLSYAAPASATRGDAVSGIYAVDEWTDSDPNQLPAEPYSQVEVTYDATYGVTLAGQIRTGLPSWKDQGLIAPTFDRPIVDVTGGTLFGMAIDDRGHLRTWGDAPPIPTFDQNDRTYRDIAAAGTSAIGLTTDGKLRYWGDAASRFTFDATMLDTVDVVSIDIDASAAVAVTADGRVLSAGGAITGAWNPDWSFPSGWADETFVAADAGTDFAVALTDTGEVVAWGVDQHEQLDVPDFPTGRRAVAISAGMWMAAAVLDDGSIIRWGTGERTQIPAQRAGRPVADIDLDRYRTAVTYAVMTNTSIPSISGTPRFGDTLTATAGEWSTTPDEVQYTWRAHDRAGDGSTVVGTDSPTYSPSADDAWNGVTISVTVTAKAAAFDDVSATSVQTDPVALRSFTTAPALTMTGEPRVGRTLTAVATDPVPVADAGEWTWFTVVRGDDADSTEDDDVSVIDGANSDSLVVTPDLAGKTVFANKTVTKAGHEPAFGETSDVVVALGSLAAPTVSVAGKPRVGQTLTATAKTSPSAKVTYQWLRGSTPIRGATARTYRAGTADLDQALRVRVSASAAGYVTGSATSSATARVTLGAKKFKVSAPRKVTVGKKATITVRGLAAGERFTVKAGSRRVTAKATRRGVGTVRVKLTGKPGKRAVKVVGSLRDRVGSGTIRVVRRA